MVVFMKITIETSDGSIAIIENIGNQLQWFETHNILGYHETSHFDAEKAEILVNAFINRAEENKGKEYLAQSPETIVQDCLTIAGVLSAMTLQIRKDSSLKLLVPEIQQRISNDDYSFILDTITHMSKVFERSPKAIAQMGEEDLRWILLVGLNVSVK